MKKIIFILFFISVSTYVAKTAENLEVIQKKLQTTFSNLNIVDFRPSHIPDLFEINLGDKIIYYYPSKELLFFGEIFNIQGVSLTGESLARQASKTLKQAIFSSGLVLGNSKELEIFEFIDPDCIYSKRSDEFLRSLSQQYNFTRRIFFDLRAHPQAKKKAMHVICSKDPNRALSEIFSDKPIKFLTCSLGKEILKKHATAAEKLGISGTPSYVYSGKIVSGFQPQELFKVIEYTKIDKNK